MTAAKKDALEALAIRLRHVAATAAMLARALGEMRDECDALGGIAANLDELSTRASDMALDA